MSNLDVLKIGTPVWIIVNEFIPEDSSNYIIEINTTFKQCVIIEIQTFERRSGMIKEYLLDNGQRKRANDLFMSKNEALKLLIDVLEMELDHE